MQLIHFTLVGYVFTALCASFCPMNMNMTMNMDMEGMHMASTGSPDLAAQMNHETEADMACERCELTAEEVAISDGTIDIQATAQVPFAIVANLASDYTGAMYSHPSGLPLANAGPPPLSQSLVGTVILRT